MAYEQSIDDILKSLKEIVSEEMPQTGKDSSVTLNNEPLSEEALKLQLKQQYSEEGDFSEDTEELYVLDHAFLAEAQNTHNNVEICESENDLIDSTEPLASIHSEDLPKDDEDLPPWEDSADFVPSCEEEETLSALDEFLNTQTPMDELCDPFVQVVQDEAEELLELVSVESSENEDSNLSLDADEFEMDEFPEIQTTELSELLRDYQSEEDVQTQYFSFSDSDALLQEMEAADDENIRVDEDDIQDAIFDLMQQLGCEDELSELEDENLSEEMRQAFVSPEEQETISSEETEERCREYQNRKIRSMVAMLATGVIALVLFFYDLIPFLGGEFNGIISHRDYPAAYLMIGFQLLLLSAFFLGKPILTGVRRMLSLRPDLYSVVSLMLIVNFAYDLTVLIFGCDALPTFHFLTALMICSVAIGEYVLLLREMQVFSIYSTEAGKTQYTLLQSEGKNSVASQMYRGGLDSTKKIYSPVAVEFPKSFFNSMREDVIGNRVISAVILPSILLSVIAMLASILLDGGVHVAAITVMVFLFATLPLNAVAAICIPLCTSATRLQKRGIALTEKKMIDQYAECDMITYHDLHLFKSCNTNDTGIVFYEQDQMTAVLGSLQILYSTIEGPMAEVFSDLPESYRFDSIRIRRIFRNGIEAFIDKKMILLVGDASFMQRYGLEFPVEEISRGRSTLCISLNGKVSAKMSVKYTTEPIFEMLAERLYKAGVQVVIETFDPMIQAGLVASARQIGDSPISVFHKSVSQLKQKEITRAQQSAEIGVLATSSRLKLAEALIWSKRLYEIRKLNNIMTGVSCAFGAILATLALMLGFMENMHQYWLLLLAIFPHMAIVIMTFIMLPKKNYFSVEACREEILAQKEAQQKKITKQKKK